MKREAAENTMEETKRHMNDISLSFKKESNDYGPIKKKHQITIYLQYPKINTYNTGVYTYNDI